MPGPNVIAKRLALAGATDFDGSTPALGLFDLSAHDYSGARWYISAVTYQAAGDAHTWDIGAHDGTSFVSRVPGGTTAGNRLDASDLGVPIPRDASGDLLPVQIRTSGKSDAATLWIEFTVKPAGMP